MRIKASKSSNTDSPSDVQSNQLDEEEMNIYLEAAGGKNKKGRIFGLGSEAKDVDSSPYSYTSSPSINTTLQPDLENVVTELRQENQNLKQQNEIILSRLEALEQKLSGGVNNSNTEDQHTDDSPP